MKTTNAKSTKRTLTLNKETLRSLNDQEMSGIGGGQASYSHYCTHDILCRPTTSVVISVCITL